MKLNIFKFVFVLLNGSGDFDRSQITRQNPTEGRCVAGGFLGPTGNETCANQEFSYEECPDVDECRLGMHNCHEKGKGDAAEGSFGWTRSFSSCIHYAIEKFRLAKLSLERPRRSLQ